MGCIRACFGKTKKHRTPTRGNDNKQSLSDGDAVKEALLSTNQTAEEAQTQIVNPPIKENTNEDELKSSSRKKVTFDILNGKTPEPEECPVQEDSPKISVENDGKVKREEKAKDEVFSESSGVSSLFSYPPNFRYRNCASSSDDDDSVDDTDLKENKKDEDTALMVQEESSESLFSLSIDSRKQNSALVDVDLGGEKEVCSPLKPFRERSNFVQQSVLNPIENLSQWKSARAKTTSAVAHREKENIAVPFLLKDNLNVDKDNVQFAFREEPCLKKGSGRFSDRLMDDEITVDTSLSSWLMGSQNAPTKENSPGYVGNSSSKSKRTNTPKSLDRPILGVLTIEELKQMSKASSPSPRRSPSPSPDEMPMIGTVGSYWRHAATEAAGADFSPLSKSRICQKKASINLTPFQTKLDRAMEDAETQI